MRRIPMVLAALVWLGSAAALAQRPLEVTVEARPSLQLILTSTVEVSTCSAAIAPLSVRDASDALWFAGGPNAQHDLEELHADQLAPLLSLADVGGRFRLFVVGAPAGTALRYAATGWQPVWPFC